MSKKNIEKLRDIYFQCYGVQLGIYLEVYINKIAGIFSIKTF